MFQKLKSYLKQEKDELLKAIIAMIIVAGIYLGYLYLFGIPMTKAKNYYNRAYLEYTDNNYEKAKASLKISLDVFYTNEAEELLTKLSK